MIHRIISIASILLLIGCQNPALPVPNISDEKMVHILADLHMAESAAKKVHGDKKDQLLEKYYDQVFRIHHISKEKFESEFAILEQNPNKLASIYEKTLQYLTVMSK